MYLVLIWGWFGGFSFSFDIQVGKEFLFLLDEGCLEYQVLGGIGVLVVICRSGSICYVWLIK